MEPRRYSVALVTDPSSVASVPAAAPTDSVDGGDGAPNGSGEPSLADVVQQLASSVDELKAGFTGYKSELNADLAKLRRRVKSPSSPSSSPTGQSKSDAGAGEVSSPAPDFASSIKLTRALVGLPDDLSSAALERVESGEPVGQVLGFIEAVKMGMGMAASAEPSTGASPTAPKGRPANGPPQPTTPAIRTQAEFQRLKKKDSRAAQALLRDPQFNLAALPYR